jgi:pimeloyl-ACP methyl ester carboxylesterase
MSEPVMKMVKGDGVRIQVAIWKGRDKQVLCVHGITANCRSWDVIASTLSPTHMVAAMDLRGRGGSDKPSEGYSLGHHLKDIHCLMDDLGLERPVIMGHSLGAFISLAFAARFPDRVQGLVLVDGGGKLSEDQLNRVFEGIRPALERLGKIFPSREAYIEIMRQTPYLRPWSPAMETYYGYELEDTHGGVRCNIHPANIQEEALNLRKVDVARFYDQVTCNTLILRATEGLFSPDDILLPEEVVQKMVREIRNSRRVDIPGANHYGIVFQPNGSRDRALLDFLKG